MFVLYAKTLSSWGKKSYVIAHNYCFLIQLCSVLLFVTIIVISKLFIMELIVNDKYINIMGLRLINICLL